MIIAINMIYLTVANTLTSLILSQEPILGHQVAFSNFPTIGVLWVSGPIQRPTEKVIFGCQP